MRKQFSETQFLDFVHSTQGRIFSLKFVKRTTKEVREMLCRTGVHSYRKGGELAYDPQSKGLVTVFDMQKNAYRAFPVDGVIEVKINGEWVDVVH